MVKIQSFGLLSSFSLILLWFKTFISVVCRLYFFRQQICAVTSFQVVSLDYDKNHMVRLKRQKSHQLWLGNPRCVRVCVCVKSCKTVELVISIAFVVQLLKIKPQRGKKTNRLCLSMLPGVGQDDEEGLWGKKSYIFFLISQYKYLMIEIKYVISFKL